mgnify:FL=1|tara:strand:+ start:1173 stop:1436 length:264 start_codon:yes stop_codon:yes gene_type:complete
MMNNDIPTKERKIYIKLYNNTRLRKFTVFANTTILEIKDLVEEKSGIPPAQQRLIYEGRQLDNDKTPDDYEITDGKTIYMVLNMRGG